MSWSQKLSFHPLATLLSKKKENNRKHWCLAGHQLSSSSAIPATHRLFSAVVGLLSCHQCTNPYSSDALPILILFLSPMLNGFEHRLVILRFYHPFVLKVPPIDHRAVCTLVVYLIRKFLQPPTNLVLIRLFFNEACKLDCYGMERDFYENSSKLSSSVRKFLMHPIPSFLSPLYFCSLVTWKNAADTFSLFL